jgi:lysophospholipase L1-like esterase
MKILFLGHSLVEWFDWQGRFPGHEVHNLGVAGETTTGLLRRSDRALSRCPEADAVLVMTGTNDLLMEDRSFLEDYRALAAKLVERCPGARIVLHSILPVHPQWVDSKEIESLNDVIREIAAESGTEFFDLTARFTGSSGEPDLRCLLADGVHLSETGYAVWSRALEELLEL